MQRQHRLKRRSAFAYVYRKGERSSAHDLMLLCARSKEGLKIGLSVSKKVGNAVARNRVKRLLREAISQIEGKIDSRFMYVVIARPSIVGLPLRKVSDEIEHVFSKAGKLQC